MTIDNVIQSKLEGGLDIAHLNIENESHMHSGPAMDTHFKVTLVSDDFKGKRLVQRHQLIYGLLDNEMQNPIHALSMHLYTMNEWQASDGEVMASPNCMGGSKADI
ncbi:MAG: BolA family protein [Neptuniibacter sp.]